MSGAAVKPSLFLGIGGMGMAPLSLWLAARGDAIVGHDDGLSAPVRRLLDAAGIELRDFVFPEELEQFNEIVHSSALDTDHPLLVAARALGIPVMRRGEKLASVTREKKLIVVAGSHGKTTTTALLVHALERSGHSINYCIGGLPGDGSPPARYVDLPWMVVELDESDGTIEHYAPAATLIVNLDWDHADHYEAETALQNTFCRLAERTAGPVVTTREVIQKLGDNLTEALRSRFVLTGMASFGADINAANRAAAAALAGALGFVLETSAFSDFSGIQRRQSKRFGDGRAAVYEDYAHHPTEIRSLLTYLRRQHPDERLIVIFQPHRYTRTRQFAAEFATELEEADVVRILPVYAAHEPFCEQGTSEAIARHMPKGDEVLLPFNQDHLFGLTQLTGDGRAVFAFVGAGDIEIAAELFASYLKSPADADQAWLSFVEARVSAETHLSRDEPLAKKTTMRVGGAARFYCEPASLADLRFVLRAAKLAGISTFLLGRGSNLVVVDSGYNGIVIRLNHQRWRDVRALTGGRFWAAAGVRLKELCGIAAKSGCPGFEFLEGIPGSVGGSLRMNAGAMGNWIFDRVEKVVFLDAEGCLQQLPPEAFSVCYRSVTELAEGVALGAIFRSAPETIEAAEAELSSEAVRHRMDTYARSRKESQPRQPSAGCIFKNPEGNHAGKLIDQCGLKGLTEGDAEVSPVHANFCVNNGSATASDVIRLVHRVRRRVAEETGYWLEPEALLLGDDWQQVFDALDASVKE